MEKTMTIKEISVLIGKTKRTIEKWCEKYSQLDCEKSSSVSEKISQAKKTMKPAEFLLDEIIEIIEKGGKSKLLASLLKDNAVENNKNLETKNKQEIEYIVLNILNPILERQNKFFERIIEKISFNQIQPQKNLVTKAIENKTEQKNYKYLTLKIIGENLNPKIKPSQVGRMLFELGYAVQINNSFAPSFRCTKENKASEQTSIYGGTFYAWHKDFIDILQGLLNKETKLF